jgi:L-ascorbate metabolism protein UlaG (beta-lactamase superfamily)
MEINYIGHSTVELVDGNTRVLIDPFLSPNNPAAKVSADDVDPTHVVITHAHQDHFADAVAVGKRTRASFVTISELANVLDEQGIENFTDPNLGGTVEFDWGWVKLVQAFHTSTVPVGERPFSPDSGIVIGAAAGAVINLGGKTFYHLGDTALFSDLQLVKRYGRIDVAIMPIGGHYTMDRFDAVVAAEWVGADTIIPCHYGTFPPIETDVEAFKADVQGAGAGEVVVLNPGDTHAA